MKYKIVLQQSEEGFSVSCLGCLDAGRRGELSKKPLKTLERPFASTWQLSAESVKDADVREIEFSV